MERVFFLSSETEPRGSHVILTSLQAKMREGQVSGMIGVQVGATRQVFLVFSHGNQAGVYLLEDNQSRPFHLAELSTLFGGAPFALRTVKFPDRAGRIIWLALESRPVDQFEVRQAETWEEHLKRWKDEQFSGIVEITSETRQGFGVLIKGNWQEAESSFFNGQGFEGGLPAEVGAANAWKATVYAPALAGCAWQCLSLRRGAVSWANESLARFQHIAGAKFLEVVAKEVRVSIQPWQWNIGLDGTTFTDEHFFPSTEAAALAYRAILMSVGAQMNFVIGRGLTQRVLTEVFDKLDQDERAALESQRLIPAAFAN